MTGQVYQEQFRNETPDFMVAGKRLVFSFLGKVSGIRLNLGARYLLEMLLHPYQEIYTVELYLRYHDENSGQDYLYGCSEAGLRLEGLELSGKMARQEMIDKRCHREVISRLRDIRADLSATEHWHDYRKKEDLLEEQEALLNYLEETTDPRGKIRVFSDMEARCGQSVRKAVRRAIERVKEQDPGLGEYLLKSLKVRDPLCYRPDISL